MDILHQSESDLSQLVKLSQLLPKQMLKCSFSSQCLDFKAIPKRAYQLIDTHFMCIIK